MQNQGTDNAFVVSVDGTMSLRKTLPQLALGDRMFTYQNKARPINPLIFTKTTQTTDETQFRALSPKNSRFDVPPASIFVVRSACTNLSCECQPHPQDYCDSNLRTLTWTHDCLIAWIVYTHTNTSVAHRNPPGISAFPTRPRSKRNTHPSFWYLQLVTISTILLVFWGKSTNYTLFTSLLRKRHRFYSFYWSFEEKA